MLFLTNLQTSSLNEPLGIDRNAIRFGWILCSEKENVRQQSYRICVQNSDETIWDSGIVESTQSFSLPYSGPELEENTFYRWTVTIRDNQGDEAEGTASFHTGMEAEHFQARWIEPDLPPVEPEPINSIVDGLLQLKKVKEPDEKLTPCSVFRKEFRLRGSVKSAYLYLSAHGIYSAQINGADVDDRFFAPEFTSYHNRILYQVYDVSAMLRQGENAFGAIVADGWWAGRIFVTGASCNYGNRHALFMQLMIEYEDGEKDIVYSDSSFRCATGPYRYADLFIGEKYDANLEIHGWSEPGFDSSAWKPVFEKQENLSTLKPQMFPPVRCVEMIPAKQIITTPKGETVIDFGQNLAGVVSMHVRAPKGTVIELQHMEELDKDGNFFVNIHGYNKQQKDTYICSGTEEEEYTPRFTFHGFRYVKVTGYPGTPRTEEFSAKVLSSDNRDTGSFICSNEKLNQLQHNIYWSQISNFISIPTDCPQRERSGYTGDMGIYAETSFFNQNNQAFLQSWLSSVTEEQFDNGAVQSYAPTNPKATSDQGIAGWGDAITIVPYEMYRNYGDTEQLRSNYTAMKKWTKHAHDRARQKNSLSVKLNPAFWFDKEFRADTRYLWNDGFHFGDWLIPSKTMGGPLGMLSSVLFGREAFVSGYYANTLRIMRDTAHVLGETADEKDFTEELEHVKKAFTRMYLKKDGMPKTNYQGIHAMMLSFDLIPEEHRQKVTDNLVRLIREKDARLDTGFLSVNLLMDALWNNGKKKEAYQLLYQNKCPSWLYEVEQGATTMWEKWDSIRPDGTKQQVSYNHYSFGCVGRFLYQHVLGIQNVGVAYDRIMIRPEPDTSLSFAEGHYESRYGLIRVAWEKKDGNFLLTTNIPCGTEATIVLPDGKEYVRGSGEYEFSCPIL